MATFLCCAWVKIRRTSPTSY